MAAVPTPISPRPTCNRTDAMGAQQASFFSSSSYPSRAAGPQSKPSALLERRGIITPSLKVTASTSSNRSQRTSASAGTSANRSEGTSAFVGTSAYNSKAAPATLYDVLGVPRTATENEIKTAYRRLAREHHPDTAPLQEKEASTTKFLQIHSAYSALSDRLSRAQYDLQLSLPYLQAAGHHNRSPNFYTAPSSNYCSPRTPFSSGRGRSWETDQCWC